eukprot:8759524-Pyramimonas_sp.AAC.1
MCLWRARLWPARRTFLWCWPRALLRNSGRRHARLPAPLSRTASCRSGCRGACGSSSFGKRAFAQHVAK